MRVASPAVIATDDFILQRRDGSEVALHAMLGAPYRDGNDRACPVALDGIDGRYIDIRGDTSLQALCLAIALVRTRLAHLLAAGEVLLYPGTGRERLDAAGMDALFGR